MRNVKLECLHKEFTHMLIGYTVDNANKVTINFPLLGMENDTANFVLEEHHNTLNECKIEIAGKNI